VLLVTQDYTTTVHNTDIYHDIDSDVLDNASPDASAPAKHS
jgi:hypothetical protein